ncbi:Uncharacterized [Moorella glycerini]|uniref:Uncharacterized protein n=2 Tax=Neomoorella TaxID=44260 RepID=A0A9X7J128_9FIRM|nr:hypothetical protein MOMUL_04170 [Moorella mulderi DSM 14980]PRR71284.1 hypothetical protein MOST_25910 [Moorella stamsii]CEP66675.1 Uncharacterized [Moorella glycerini]
MAEVQIQPEAQVRDIFADGGLVFLFLFLLIALFIFV